MKPDLELELLAQIRLCGLPEPEMEYRFHSVRKWRFDFCWPDRMIAVEVEGGTWAMGRHTRPAGYEADCEKYTEATLLGWRLLRFTGDMIKDGRALNFIIRALDSFRPQREAHE